MKVRLKRVYEAPAKSDGTRVLVDRLWPRGLRKDKAQIDVWLKELAPSTELRKWFAHDPARWREFGARYRRELRSHKAELARLKRKSRAGAVTLVFGARDEQHNQAVVIKQLLQGE